MSSPLFPKESNLLLARGRLKSGWAERPRPFPACDVTMLGKGHVLHALPGFYDCAVNAIRTPEAAAPAMTLVSPCASVRPVAGAPHAEAPTPRAGPIFWIKNTERSKCEIFFIEK